MKEFEKVVGTAVAFMQANINTDRILPGEWMMRVYREGFAAGLFADERYLQNGTPNPDFILNKQPWSGASILLADRNFGCGSTREEAPLALYHFGFRCLIAPSFASVFFTNCFRNGILPIELPIDVVQSLAKEVTDSAGSACFTVDLVAERLMSAALGDISFRSPPRLREMLMKGLDEIGLTLTYTPQIEAFRLADRKKRNWVYSTVSS